MSPTTRAILEMLADGRPVSGSEIGRSLGISRMAVSKAVRQLAEMGLDVAARPGRGYQLSTPLELLDAEALAATLHESGHRDVHLEVHDSLPSTSDFLLERLHEQPGASRVCLVEHQHRGRGRRERAWHAAPWRNLTLSVAQRFDTGMAGLAGLGVASGIAVVEALHASGLDPAIGLKWPNDLVWNDRKLGGLLIDVRGEHGGPCHAVLGLGVNLSLDAGHAAAIDQPHATLEQIHSGLPSRNALAAALVTALLQLFADYAEHGFEPWFERWAEYDRLGGRPVTVLRGAQALHGIASGIDRQGALLVDLDDGTREAFHSGEVSVRRAP